MKSIYKVWLLVIFSLIFTGLLLFNCTRKTKEIPLMSTGALLTSQKAVFVGREACKKCHEKEYNLYHNSDHDKAMDIADSATVLGDFNGSVFSHLGITSKFYKKKDRYFVYTEGAGGHMKEFEVKYVFGYYPLQQYLIEFPGGRYQCLPICWDSRPKNEGGQRWFHIYGNERIAPDDILYWTGIMQNWNYMCAECHSTDLKKNYDYKNEIYHTTWKEIDVSCEACHGPASLHVLWADANEKGNPPDIPNMGFNMPYRDPGKGTWVIPKDSSTAIRTSTHDTRQLLDMCARCHARRGVISENYQYGKSFLNTHQPALLDENLYYPDGQILDEDYEYASFLQSKMYRAGVFCTDCHDPHSTGVYVAGNALCYRCHSAEKYGSKKHHFHKEGSTGAQCTACHMPTRKYMVVDPRLDHSIRIPRPDLSLKLGTPNACNQCHTDKSIQWAADAARQWYGDPAKYGKHYGEVIAEARKSSPFIRRDLIKLADDTAFGPMVRSTVLSLMEHYPETDMISPIILGLNDKNPLVQYGALQASRNLPDETKKQYLYPLLSDSILLIRTTAASILTLSGIRPATQAETDKLDKVDNEYVSTQLLNADFPSSSLNLGIFYMAQHRYDKAEEAYKTAIKEGPTLPFAYINLADLYRQEEKENDCEAILRQGLKANPGMAGVHHSLALVLVRKGDRDNALRELERSVELEPENAQYSYTFAIALFSAGNYKRSLSVLKNAIKTSPYNQEILYALSTINRDTGNKAEALLYAKQLASYYPDNQNYKQLAASLSAQD